MAVARPAAIALIGPLAWEFPYAAGAAQKTKKKKKKRKKEKELDARASQANNKSNEGSSLVVQWVKDLMLSLLQLNSLL